MSIGPARVRVAHIEITQGLQIHDNSLPLVMGRPTVVRVLPAVNCRHAGMQVTAQLRARPNGESWSHWIDPDNGPLPAASRPWRGDPAQALEFTLDPQWYSRGSSSKKDFIETQFEIKIRSPAGAAAFGNRQFSARFYLRRELRIGYTVVEFLGVPPRNRVHSQDAAGLVRTFYPIDPTQLVYQPCSTPKVAFSRTEPNLQNISNLHGAELILTLNEIYFNDPTVDRLYAWTPEGAYTANGRSDPLFLKGFGKVAFGNDGGDPDDSQSWRWRRTFAHEMGHNTDKNGLVHPPDPYYEDFYPAKLQDDEFGFDILKVQRPKKPDRLQRDFAEHKLFDVMVGGKRDCEAWIGRTNYRRLFDFLSPVLEESEPDPEPGLTNVLLTSGIIEKDHRGILRPLARLGLTERTRQHAVQTPSGSGVAEVRFYRSDGSEIRHLRIGWTPRFMDAEGKPVHSVPFTWLVRLSDADQMSIAGIRLFYYGHLIDSADGNAAVVIQNLTVQTGGSGADHHITIIWEVPEDPAVPELLQRVIHRVFYSPDQVNWRLVASGLTGAGPSVSIPAIALPRGNGDQGFIRVQSAHGTTIAQEEMAVSLEPALPRITIVAPLQDQEYPSGSSILLMGYAFLGDERVPADQLQWFLVEGDDSLLLGTGEKLVLRRGPVSHNRATDPGFHDIHLVLGDHRVSVGFQVLDSAQSATEG